MNIEESIPIKKKKKKRFKIHSSKVAMSSSKSNSNEKKPYTSKATKNMQKRNAPISSATLIPSKISGNQTLITNTDPSMPSEIQSEIPQPIDFTENSMETERVMRKEILNNSENANESLIAHNLMPTPETSTKTPYKSKAAELIRSRNATISSPKIFEIPKQSVKPKSFQSTEISFQTNNSNEKKSYTSKHERKIYVTNIHPEVNWKKIQELFTKKIGKVKNCWMMRPGTFTIEFYEDGMAEKAKNILNGFQWKQNKISIQKYEKKIQKDEKIQEKKDSRELSLVFPRFENTNYFEKAPLSSQPLEIKHTIHNIFDSHCHLDRMFYKIYGKYNFFIDKVPSKYKGPFDFMKHEFKSKFPASFEGFINVITNPAYFDIKYWEWIVTNEPNVYLALGCHPSNVSAYDELANSQLEKGN